MNLSASFFPLLVAIVIGVCQGATFNNPSTPRCRYPNWKCDCKLVYDCSGSSEFPADVGADPTVSGYVKDLTPKDYPLEIPGKRWRRNWYQTEDYCERECTDRMNAFLCLDGSSLADYSYSAICIKLLGLGIRSEGNGPFEQNGDPEPCCTIHLAYGPHWCSPKWSSDVGTARCLTRNLDPSFGTEAPTAVSHAFSVETGCEAADFGGGDFNWCTAAPMCAPAPEP